MDVGELDDAEAVEGGGEIADEEGWIGERKLVAADVVSVEGEGGGGGGGGGEEAAAGDSGHRSSVEDGGWLVESPIMIPLGRKRRVMAAVKAAGADAMVVTSLTDIRYLTGFTGSSAVLVLVGGKATFFTDGRYTTQAGLEVDGAKIVIAERNVLKAAVEFAVAAGVARCGFDSAGVTVAGLEAMRLLLPAKLRKSFFVAMPDVIANLRQVKDEVEQEAMREAAALGCRLFEGVLEHIVPGATEMEVAMALEYMARLEGAEGMSFESIVAGGTRSALPHARATNAKLPRRRFVMMDFGVLLGGYCSDMTRMVHLGAGAE